VLVFPGLLKIDAYGACGMLDSRSAQCSTMSLTTLSPTDWAASSVRVQSQHGDPRRADPEELPEAIALRLSEAVVPGASRS